MVSFSFRPKGKKASTSQFSTKKKPGVFSRIFGKFKKKKPQTPNRHGMETLGGGHRGIAIGSSKKPNLSKENIAKWVNLTASEVEGFLYDEEFMPVHSSNIAGAQFFGDEQMMIVEFLTGAAYKVFPISEAEALLFAKAQSKGIWYWDYVRIRGTRDGHKKNVSRVSSGYQPPKKGPTAKEAEEFFQDESVLEELDKMLDEEL